MNRRIMLTTAFLAAAATAPAQNVRQEVRVFHGQSGDVVTHDVAGPVGMGTMQFIGAGHADGKIVKNAPYSGETATEITRVLADGTRIVNRDTATVARDKEGRMRRETNLANIGPFATQTGQTPRFVTITDPVSKEVSVLNLNERTANKSKMGEPVFYRTESDSGSTRQVRESTFDVRVERRTSGGTPGPADTAFIATAPPPTAGVMVAAPAFRMAFDSRNTKTEDLGVQDMEGVRVRGTRTTHTIPSGQIGNDRDIVSTTETWFSDELQMTIFSKTVDPQFGETVYRINNLRRAEPDASLFRIPAEFKIQEHKGGEPIMIRKLLKQEGNPDQI